MKTVNIIFIREYIYSRILTPGEVFVVVVLFSSALCDLYRPPKGKDLTFVEFLLWAKMVSILPTSSSLITKHNCGIHYIPYYTEWEMDSKMISYPVGKKKGEDCKACLKRAVLCSSLLISSPSPPTLGCGLSVHCFSLSSIIKNSRKDTQWQLSWGHVNLQKKSGYVNVIVPHSRPYI